MIVQLFVFLFLSNSAVAGSRRQRIVEGPQDTKVQRGNDAVLRCRVENQEGPVQWTKDRFGLGSDRSLPGFPRYQMIGSHTGQEGAYHLEVKNVVLEDDAEYQCQLGRTTEQEGDYSSPVRLTILVPPAPPRIVNFVDVIEERENREFTVVCVSDGGKPPAVISWSIAESSDGAKVTRKISGKQVENDVQKQDSLFNVRSSLRFRPKQEDNGRYLICKTKHDTLKEGLVAASLLRIDYAPRVLVSLNSTAPLREGHGAVLHCSVDAQPADQLTYVWKRDSSLLQGYTGPVLAVSRLGREHHESLFECEARNRVGTGSAQYLMRLQYAPQMVSLPQRVPVDVGESVTLECLVDSHPPAAVRWFRLGAEHHTLARGANFTIKKVKPIHQGSYKCEATVKGFEPISLVSTVFINGKPTVLMPGSVEASTGEVAEIVCDIRGYPLPSVIAWSRGGKVLNIMKIPRYELRQMPQEEGIVSILRITEVEPEDLDEFNCTATNKLGTDSASTRLISTDGIPLYFLIPGLVILMVVLFLLLLLAIMLCRKCVCRSKSSTNGDEHSDVTVKVEALDGNGLPINYYPDMYSPAGQDNGDPMYGKDYLPVPQDNPDLDLLPPPYSSYVHAPASSLYTASTFQDPSNHHLVTMTYIDDRPPKHQHMLLYADPYGNILDSNHMLVTPESPIYYANGHMAPMATLEPVQELPTPEDLRDLHVTSSGFSEDFSTREPVVSFSDQPPTLHHPPRCPSNTSTHV